MKKIIDIPEKVLKNLKIQAAYKNQTPKIYIQELIQHDLKMRTQDPTFAAYFETGNVWLSSVTKHLKEYYKEAIEQEGISESEYYELIIDICSSRINMINAGINGDELAKSLDDELLRIKKAFKKPKQ